MYIAISSNSGLQSYNLGREDMMMSLSHTHGDDVVAKKEEDVSTHPTFGLGNSWIMTFTNDLRIKYTFLL